MIDASHLELAPTLSEAWMTLAGMKADSWDWPEMEEYYRKAIELNPNNAQAHGGLGQRLDAMGRLDEGLKESQIVQELDPNQVLSKPDASSTVQSR